jgi:hypothetical protein
VPKAKAPAPDDGAPSVTPTFDVQLVETGEGKFAELTVAVSELALVLPLTGPGVDQLVLDLQRVRKELP